MRLLPREFFASLQKYDCRYGAMLTVPSDNVISRSLRIYGEWAEHELSVLRSFISVGATVVDVGANIGTHALPFSLWVGNGRIIAIEAQPHICQVLRLNCLRNDRRNVDVVNAVCADTRGSIAFRPDYAKEHNFGAVSFAGLPSDTRRGLFRWLHRFRRSTTLNIPVITLDELCGKAAVSLIKIDIEGMELDALRGAQEVIARCHPVIYFEQNNTERLSNTHRYLTNFGYRMFWLETHPFNRNNFRGVTDNIWWRTETGILALPIHATPPADLIPLNGNEITAPARFNARDGVTIKEPAFA